VPKRERHEERPIYGFNANFKPPKTKYGAKYQEGLICGFNANFKPAKTTDRNKPDILETTVTVTA
jgi:hypothetical protein